MRTGTENSKFSRATGIVSVRRGLKRVGRKSIRSGRLPLVLPLSLLLIAHSSKLVAQSQIRHGTFSSAGRNTSSGESRIHGTLSQGVIGLTQGNTFHEAGFWRRAMLPNSETVITLPAIETAVGHHLTIPLRLESVSGSLAGATRSFSGRIRFNATLLEPTGSSPDCIRVGDTCFMEISGTAPLVAGTLVSLEFRAKLGNDTATSLVIEEFTWDGPKDERNRIIRVDGTFSLLGVCREGDSVRLIHSGPSAARIRLQPNPARQQTIAHFISVETGPTELILYDLLGKEITLLSRFEAEAEQLYQLSLDLHAIPNGAYTLVCRTPSAVLSERLILAE